MAINLKLVMNRDHSYHQKSWSIEVRRMLVGISRKPSIIYIHIHSLSVLAALYADSECFISLGAYYCRRNVLKINIS